LHLFLEEQLLHLECPLEIDLPQSTQFLGFSLKSQVLQNRELLLESKKEDSHLRQTLGNCLKLVAKQFLQYLDLVCPLLDSPQFVQLNLHLLQTIATPDFG